MARIKFDNPNEVMKFHAQESWVPVVLGGIPVALPYGFEAALGACFALLLYPAAPFLLRCFLEDEQVIRAGTEMLRFMQLSSLLVGVSLVTTCVCQAVGSASGALILSLSRQGVLFFVTITLLTARLGFRGILLAQPAADLLTGLLAAVILSRILRRFGKRPVDT